MTISATTRGLRPGVCTSTTRPSSPFDGQLIYETDTNRVAVYDTSSWVYKTPASTTGSVLQVVSTTKTDVFTTTSTTFVDVTGLSVSITPSSASSKILVLGSIKFGFTGGASATHMRLVRDSTAIFIGDADGVRSRDSGYVRDTYESPNSSIVFLDSPSTTSAVTYKIQLSTYDVSRTAIVNRDYENTNSATLSSRLASTVTVMEIAG